MRILGIETSADETAAAIVENGTKILSNVIASSAEIQSKTGGIIPENAARQQIKYIIPVLSETLKKYTWQKIDAIAITVGPGLIGSLLVGVETAKTLSYLTNKKIIPVNHLVGHIYANWLETGDKSKVTRIRLPKFPALALVVSGGHTDLIQMKNHGKVTWIGGTRDDAAGEAFDKGGRLMGLPYPAGPVISILAEKYRNENPDTVLNLLPRPMIKTDSFDWSFSGLKTALIKFTTETNQFKIPTERLAAEVQEAIADVLVDKTMRAIQKYRPRSFLLAGGVAANTRLREKLKSKIDLLYLDVDFRVPIPELCTDNASYIASFAYFNFKPISWEKLIASPSISIADKV